MRKLPTWLSSFNEAPPKAGGKSRPILGRNPQVRTRFNEAPPKAGGKYTL